MPKIYALLAPGKDKIRYVGKTSRSLAHRLNVHVSKAKANTGIPVFDWLRSLDVRPNIGLVEQVSDEEWVEAERAWISYFSQFYDLLNILPGGEGMPSGEEHPCNGTELSEEHKRKISKATSGQNNPFYGQTHTDEAKQRIGRAHLGKTISKEQKKQIHVLSYEQAEEVRGLYQETDLSQRQLADKFGVSTAVVCRIVNGKIYND